MGVAHFNHHWSGLQVNPKKILYNNNFFLWWIVMYMVHILFYFIYHFHTIGVFMYVLAHNLVLPMCACVQKQLVYVGFHHLSCFHSAQSLDHNQDNNRVIILIIIISFLIIIWSKWFLLVLWQLEASVCH